MKFPKFLPVVFLALFAVYQAPPAFAQERSVEFEQRLQDARERLGLSDAQVEAMAPILRESHDARMAVMERYGVGPFADGSGRPPRSEMRALRDEMKAIQDQTMVQLASVLDDAQLAEYEQMQKDARKAMKSQMKGKRQAL